MRYIRPKSLSWWSGAASIATGCALMAFPDHYGLGQFGVLLTMLAGGGDASPAMLIYLGLGIIGIRDRIERGMKT
jgi:hypothetical protein